MPAKVDIRTATQSDIMDLIRLNRIVQEEHVTLAPKVYRADLTDEEIGNFWSERLEDSHHRAAIAVLDDLLAVGSILFELQTRPATTFAYARRIVNIHQLVVVPERRRLGIATKLMNFAEKEAAIIGVTEAQLSVWSSNSVAQSFYSTQGYDEGIVIRRKFLSPV